MKELLRYTKSIALISITNRYKSFTVLLINPYFDLETEATVSLCPADKARRIALFLDEIFSGTTLESAINKEGIKVSILLTSDRKLVPFFLDNKKDATTFKVRVFRMFYSIDDISKYMSYRDYESEGIIRSMTDSKANSVIRLFLTKETWYKIFND